ncbi:MAG: hypothetical protein JWL59_2290 [Chthoniobacteraceae bacterium]|nr:hypothetical protein [Chthoniobacteraceae bacterium]
MWIKLIMLIGTTTAGLGFWDYLASVGLWAAIAAMVMKLTHELTCGAKLMQMTEDNMSGH